MAAGVLPKPGTQYGPCDASASCGHADCAETVRESMAVCTICGRPIGYGTRFYQVREPDERVHPLTDTAGAPYWLQHATCAEENAERARNP
jgi:hypothetical protein